MQKGIALVQILIFSAILSIVALYFSRVAVNQVEISQLTNDKTLATVSLHSAKQKLFYDLLTIEKTFSIDENTPYQWNFFGDSFELKQGVTVKAYDLSSRINIRYPERERLIALLQYLGMSSSESSEWVVSLLEYQDVDKIDRYGATETSSFSVANRNGPLSNKAEFLTLGLPEYVLTEVMANVSLYNYSTFNPLNASFELLAALYGKDIATQVIELRKQKNLTKAVFKSTTGIKEGDNVFLFPGNNLELQFSSVVNDAAVSKSWIVRFNPYATREAQPVTFVAIKE